MCIHANMYSIWFTPRKKTTCTKTKFFILSWFMSAVFYQSGWCLKFVLPVFFTWHHGKAPLNHHVGEYFSFSEHQTSRSQYTSLHYHRKQLNSPGDAFTKGLGYIFWGPRRRGEAPPEDETQVCMKRAEFFSVLVREEKVCSDNNNTRRILLLLAV